MFAQLDRTNYRRGPLLVSFAIHCLVLWLLVRRPQPIFVTPSAVAFGNRGTSTEVVYLTRDGLDRAQSASTKAEHLQFRAPVSKVRQQRKLETSASKPATQPASDIPVESARAGSPFGSLSEGRFTGYEAKPALPIVFPEPLISKSDIPAGVEGDVIVEVTIDAQGNVVGTKVLASLNYGIEEKVLAALQNWRFKPATMDGVPVPSQHNVYFHYPK